VLGKDGQPRLLETYYTATKPARRPSASGEAVGDAETEGEEPAPSASLPRSLEEQMAKDRRDVLALHIAHDPALALDLAIFSLARDHAGHFGYSDTGCTIRITDRNEPSGLTGIPASSAVTELEQQRASLPNDWASEEDSFASFLAFRSLDDGVKAGWLAYAVSQSLKASLASGTHACTFQSRLGAEIGIDMAQHWRPGAETSSTASRRRRSSAFWAGSIPKSPCAMRRPRRPNWRRLRRACVLATRSSSRIKAKALAWVPDVMRFGGLAAILSKTASRLTPSLMGPRICPSTPPIRTMPTARSAKRPDPQPRTATGPILLPRQSGRRMQRASKARIRRRPSHEAPSRHLCHRHRPACRRD
jgi:ParB family chromosome partitioning protein